jgi:hypothetical protein
MSHAKGTPDAPTQEGFIYLAQPCVRREERGFTQFPRLQPGSSGRAFLNLFPVVDYCSPSHQTEIYSLFLSAYRFIGNPPGLNTLGLECFSASLLLLGMDRHPDNVLVLLWFLVVQRLD